VANADEQHLEAYAQRLAAAFEAKPTVALAQEWLRAQLALRRPEVLANCLERVRSWLDEILGLKTEEEATEDELLLLIQWNETTLLWYRMQARLSDKFEELAYYEEILHHTSARTEPRLRLAGHQARIRLLWAWQLWTQQRRQLGLGHSLPAEVEGWLAQQQAACETEARAELEAWQAEGELPAAFGLKRELALHLMRNDKPNEGLVRLKELVTDCGLLPDYHAGMLGERLEELGEILSQYGKVEAAQRYLHQALAAYQEAGEEWEVHAAQVESRLQELAR